MGNFSARAAIVACALLTSYAGGVVNQCSEQELRAALAEGGTVVINCSGGIVLSETIHIENDTVLDARGHTGMILGGGSARLFTVAEAVSFTILGADLRNGRHHGSDGVATGGGVATLPEDGMGGAILSLGGKVSLIDCTIAQNEASGGNAVRDSFVTEAAGGLGRGGAICALSGSLSLSNCVLFGNRSMGGIGNRSLASGNGQGGAIYVQDAELRVEKCSIDKNQGRGGQGWGDELFSFVRAGSAHGGAIYLTNSAFRLAESKFSDNRAEGTQGGGPGATFNAGSGYGGALYITGNRSGNIIDRCLFGSNVVTAGSAGKPMTPGSSFGGAIATVSPVTVLNATFLKNTAVGGGGVYGKSGHGGAVWSTAGLAITGSTFDGNSAAGGLGSAMGPWVGTPPFGGEGAGGAVWASGVLASTNCTFAHNQAFGGDAMLSAASAGGLGLGGAIALGNAQATLQHLTLASNLAWTGKSPVDRLPGSGDQIWVATNGTVNIQNSILAGSGPGSTNDNVHGTITDGEYNISSDSTPAFTAASSRNGLNPMLGALTNNGGPTATMALLEGSPARDAIPALEAAAFDQRGFARPQGPSSDIGAFEVEVLNTLALAITRLGQSSIAIRFTAEDQRTYRLLRSTNLVDWEAAQTRADGEAGPAEFIESDEEGNGRFFRVVTP